MIFFCFSSYFDRIRRWREPLNFCLKITWPPWLQHYTQATWPLDHIALRSERKRLITSCHCHYDVYFEFKIWISFTKVLKGIKSKVKVAYLCCKWVLWVILRVSDCEPSATSSRFKFSNPKWNSDLKIIKTLWKMT